MYHPYVRQISFLSPHRLIKPLNLSFILNVAPFDRIRKPICPVNSEKNNNIFNIAGKLQLFPILFNCDIIHNSNVSLDEQPHRRHHHVQLSFVDCLVSKIGRNI